MRGTAGISVQNPAWSAGLEASGVEVMVKVRIVIENSQGSVVTVFDEDVKTLEAADKAAKIMNCAVLLEAALQDFWGSMEAKE
ncbi:MAG: hypothetical protein QXR17_07790 [Candidatus Bathyarchaeia archaeon]